MKANGFCGKCLLRPRVRYRRFPIRFAAMSERAGPRPLHEGGGRRRCVLGPGSSTSQSQGHAGGDHLHVGLPRARPGRRRGRPVRFAVRPLAPRFSAWSRRRSARSGVRPVSSGRRRMGRRDGHALEGGKRPCFRAGQHARDSLRPQGGLPRAGSMVFFDAARRARRVGQQVRPKLLASLSTARGSADRRGACELIEGQAVGAARELVSRAGRCHEAITASPARGAHSPEASDR
jgi:hypothetical protein